MICPYCNKKISDNNQFCPECGLSITQEKTISKASSVYWDVVEKNIEKDKKTRIETENKIREETNHKKKIFAKVIIGLLVVIGILCYVLAIRPIQQYDSASKYLENGEFHTALKIFESLEDYKDSEEQAEVCRNNIKEQDYLAAINQFNSKNILEALAAFRDLNDYKNSRDYAGECEVELIRLADEEETVTLGTFNDSPIEWIILTKNETSVLLVSKYYVVSKIANENDSGEYGKYLCWSGSTLRKWLNNDFVAEAFPKSVSDLLITNIIQTDEYDVPNYDGWGAEEITVTTEDKVYIACKADIENYNLSPTSLMGSSNDNIITGWLRDRGHGIAFQVSYEPDGTYGSEWHFYSSYGIRPIIQLSLNGDIIEDETGDIETGEDNADCRMIPDDAYEWENHFYYVFDNCSSWEDAEKYCESLGGHLAVISSDEENNNLFSYVESLGYKSAYFDEGSWYWITGEDSVYENWHAPTEPNAENPNEDYAMFYYKYNDGTWNDGDFGGATVNGGVAFICEWD